MANQQNVGRQFFSGNTLEQAILAAARHHGLDPDEVAYKARDKKHGFLNIRRRVVIEVDPEAPKRPEGAPRQSVSVSDASGEGESASAMEMRSDRAAHEDRRDDGRRSRATWYGEDSSWVGEGDSNDELAALETAIEELNGLVGADLEASIQRDEEGFDVELSGAGSELLRKNQGSGLVAAEHLLSRMVRGLSGRGVLCRVDSEGFRETHEESLTELAQEAAERVRDEGRERRLEPMNPADRRLIHMALADDPTVHTESDGTGFMKRVRIVPSEV